VVVVVPEGTKPPATASVTITVRVPGAEPREVMELLLMDERGRAVVTGFPPGTHAARVKAPGFAEAVVSITVPSETPLRIALVPQGGG
jgi:hypothetical protein